MKYCKYDLTSIPIFREIRIELTNLCGCKCFMCPRQKLTRKLGKMTNEQLRIILSKLDPFKNKYISFWGIYDF